MRMMMIGTVVACLLMLPNVMAEDARNASAADRLAIGSQYIQTAFGAHAGDPLYDPKYDLDRSGTIDGVDLALFTREAEVVNGDGWVHKNACYNKPTPYVPDEILVKFGAAISAADREQRVTSAGGRILATGSRSQVLQVRVPQGMSIDGAVAVFSAMPGILYAEPNYYKYPLWKPNDRFYSLQWHFSLINMEQAWDVSRGDPAVKVAVVDTGIAYADGSKTESLNCCSATAYAGAINYCAATDFNQTAFWGAKDLYYNDDYAWDDEGHGTHVAGTIAQSTNNNRGCAGIAHLCTIMPVKISDSCGCSDDYVMSEGIYYAVDNGARVINISFGGPGASSTLHDACAYAYDHGIWIVAAAGNDGKSPIFFPAGYPETIAVGAVNFKKEVTTYSNYGASSYGHGIDFVAPGGDENDYNNDSYIDGVLQESFPSPAAHGSSLQLYTCNNFNFYFFIGTSMATPHVTGVIALMISAGVTDRDEIYAVLKQTAQHLGSSGKDDRYGYGLIDAGKALEYAKYGWGLNN